MQQREGRRRRAGRRQQRKKQDHESRMQIQRESWQREVTWTEARKHRGGCGGGGYASLPR